jgi:hypothetical protein
MDSAWQAMEECIQIPEWPFITFYMHGRKVQEVGSENTKWIQFSARTHIMKPIRRIAVMAGSPTVSV